MKLSTAPGTLALLKEVEPLWLLAELVLGRPDGCSVPPMVVVVMIGGGSSVCELSLIESLLRRLCIIVP